MPVCFTSERRNYGEVMSADMSVNTEISQYYHSHSYCKDTAERRLYLLENKLSNLLQELYKQTGEARKMFVLKNELEDLSLEY